VMHWAQYLWITSYYARREALAAATEWRARSYFAGLILGGIALFLPGPWLISYLAHYDFTSTMLIFTAIVNIHHFLLDGAIWKLREGRIAALLISGPTRVGSSLGRGTGRDGGMDSDHSLESTRERRDGAKDSADSPPRRRGSATENWIIARLLWIGSARPGARAFRVGSGALLVLLAVTDQTRFFLAVDARNLSNLSRATRLNPYDEAVHARLARAGEDTGDADRAVAEFRRAVRLNPRDAETRAGFIRLLLQNERYQEAYDEYKLLAPYIRRDTDSLVNFGILAERLGHHDEAIETWDRTLAIDPDSKSANIYLADALFAAGRPQEAVPHYERYLALLTSNTETRLDPGDVFGVALRVGDAYTASKDFERALFFYHKASDIAKQMKAKSLE